MSYFVVTESLLRGCKDNIDPIPDRQTFAGLDQSRQPRQDRAVLFCHPRY